MFVLSFLRQTTLDPVIKQQIKTAKFYISIFILFFFSFRNQSHFKIKKTNSVKRVLALMSGSQQSFHFLPWLKWLRLH